VGTAKGDAPGEFRNPIDYDFDDKNNIWVCDSETSLISVFDSRGTVVRTVRVAVSPLRIKVIADDRFLLMLNGNERLFGVFDTTGKKLYSFGTFIEDQIKNDIVLDGWIARVGREGFVYTSLYAGLLAAFSFQGELWSYAEAITPHPLPNAVSTAEGGTYVDPQAAIVHRDVCTIADTAFILSRFGIPSDQGSVIDAYNLREGTYLYSINVPQKARSALVTPDRVYTLADTSITIWKR
jgi:DNA-binding beta-propeller fold protein YncE